jgi:ketose-bisphosphate aldolase
MRFVNAKLLCDRAAEEGFGVPALNTNGGTYDLARAIIEAAEELQSPLIIQCYEPNLEYRGYEYAADLIRSLAAGCSIPIALALDHGTSAASVFRALKAGFTHVMIDYADEPLEENARGARQIIEAVRPLGLSVEAEVGEIIKSSDTEDRRAGTVSVEEVKAFLSLVDVDLLAVAVGTTHGIFAEQHGIDFELISQLHAATRAPLVLHGTCGVSMADIRRSVEAGMTKINFGEGLRMNYIRYFDELSHTLDHEQHAWRVMRACKDRTKADVLEIIRAVGSEGKAARFRG